MPARRTRTTVSIPVDKVRALTVEVLDAYPLVSIPVDKVRADIRPDGRISIDWFQSPWIRFALDDVEGKMVQVGPVSIPVDKVRAKEVSQSITLWGNVSIPVDKVRA